MEKHLIPVFLVAVITWGGVLLYLVRLTALLKAVQGDVEALESRDSKTL